MRRLAVLPFLVSLLVVTPSVARATAPAPVGFLASPFSAGGQAWGTTVADVTSDGRADLVVTTHGPGTNASIDRDLLVFAQQPDGTLPASPAIYDVPGATAASPLPVAVGEFSGDATPDVVVGQDGAFDVFVQAAGVFQAPVAFATSGAVQDLHVADLNGDGLDDVVFSVRLTASTYRYAYQLQRTDHSFGNGTAIGQGTASTFAVGDVNGDGAPDVVIEDSSAADVRLFLNDGGATFTQTTDPRAGQVASATVADVTGDGRNDLVLLTPSGVQVLAGNVDGSLADPVTTGGVLADATTVQASDLNLDGTTDVVVVAPGGTQTFLQDAGVLVAPCPFPSVTPSPAGGDRTVAIGDLNGDGRPDVVGAQGADAVRILTQQAPGTRTGSTVTVQAVPATIELDASVTVSGEVTLGSGGCLGVTTVAIVRQDGTGSHAVGEATLTFVDPTTYAFTIDDTPPSVGDSTYTAAFAGDDWHLDATSGAAAVSVERKTPDLSLTSKDAEIAPGDTTTLIAHLVGPAVGSSVDFHLASTGEVIGTAVTNANSNARLDVTVQKRTTYVATFAGDATWKAAGSNTVTVDLIRKASSLALKAADGTVTYGKRTTLTATLKGGSGTRKIHFSKVVDGSRKLLGTVAANAKGVATFKVSPGANATFVATYDGNRLWKPATSPKVAVKVRVVVTNRMTDYSLKEGSVAVYDCCRGYVFIKVAPNHAGKQVKVLVEYSTPSGWKSLGGQRFTLKKDGAVKVFLDVAGGSGYRFRTHACFPSDADHVGACAAWVGFRFR